jgi:hypothetical protein
MRQLLAAVLLSLLLAFGITLALTVSAASHAADRYDVAHRGLVADLVRAHAVGYADADLGQVTAPLRAVETERAPPLFGRREFFDHQVAQLAHIQALLHDAQATGLAQYKDQAASVLGEAEQAALDAEAVALDPVDLAAAQAGLPTLRGRLGAAATPAALRPLIASAQAARNRLKKLAADQTIETSAIAVAAQGLVAKHQGKVDDIRAEAFKALAAARNDGAIAAYLKLPDDDRNVRRLEAYGAQLSAGDVKQLSTAAAGVEHYQAAVHDYLLGHMPSQAIVLSLDAQQLTGYEGSKVVVDTPVTTGKPALATDTGAMKVLSKQAPWKMHSPWPKGSPFWYPDTLVREVVWFTNTGEGLHDASWEPASDYGKGSQLGRSASHGCVHVPNAAEDFLYNWAAVGTPVIVYPGDGTPVADQLKQSSVDASGQPLTGPKGA